MGNELSALCEVAGEAIDRLALTPAESLHGAIATRVFKAVGPAATPTRLIHDGITRLVYGGIRTATKTTARAAGAAVRALNAGTKSLSASRRGRLALGALNAILGSRHHPLGWALGDLLVRTHSASGRHRTRRVPVADDEVVHVGGLTHFDLLDHPRVYEVLAARLTPTAP